MSNIERVAVIGYGYWGRKMAKKFHDLGVLTTIIESDETRLQEAAKDLPGLSYHPVFTAGDQLNDFEAVAIATPPETHDVLAMSALKKNLHVFCEKPLSTGTGEFPNIGCYDQAKQLEDLAIDRNLRLQVGHIYLSSTGLLGIPRFYGGVAINIRMFNIGGAPSESTRKIQWAGLPHALSICLHILGTQVGDLYTEEAKDRSSVNVCLRYDFQQSACWIQVADYTGIRQRSIHIHADDETFLFHADQPNQWLSRVPGESHWTTHVEAEKEPLLKELEDFLTGEVNTDRMGSRVAKLTDRILYCMRQGRIKDAENEHSEAS